SRVGIEQAGLISTVAWSPDGTLIALATEEGLVLVWRVADSDLLWRLELAGGVNSLFWRPNGEQLGNGAADGGKGGLFIWDVRQGAPMRRLEGHSGFIWGIDWSAEHDLLVSAGADGTVRW